MVGKMSFRMTACNLFFSFLLSSSIHMVFSIWTLFCSPYSGTILPKAVNNITMIAIEKRLFKNKFKICIYFLVSTFPVQVLSKIL